MLTEINDLYLACKDHISSDEVDLANEALSKIHQQLKHYFESDQTHLLDGVSEDELKILVEVNAFLEEQIKMLSNQRIEVQQQLGQINKGKSMVKAYSDFSSSNK